MELSLQIALEIVLWEGRSQTFLSHQMENKQLRFFSLLFVFQEEWGWTPLSWLTEAVVIPLIVVYFCAFLEDLLGAERVLPPPPLQGTTFIKCF